MGARYLVVRRRENTDWDEAYAVVDTDVTGSRPGEGEGRIVCPSVSNADAHLIAQALNGQPAEQLDLAKAALRDIHLFIAAEVDKDAPSDEWAHYYTDAGQQALVAKVQRDHLEPF